MQDAVHYAYFAPYTLDDHMALVSELQSDDRVRLHVLGETLDGHDIDMLQIGDRFARNHGSRSMTHDEDETTT